MTNAVMFMNKNRYIFLLTLGIASACTTIMTYPKQQAKAFCKSMFSCMDPSELQDITGYASQEECIEAEKATILSSKTYSDWTKDSDSFNSDQANICLDELKSIRSETECDGTMDYSSVLLSCVTADNFPEKFAEITSQWLFRRTRRTEQGKIRFIE